MTSTPPLPIQKINISGRQYPNILHIHDNLKKKFDSFKHYFIQSVMYTIMLSIYDKEN